MDSPNKLVEVVNDTNGDLINLHRIIKTRQKSLELELSNMLSSREILESIKKGEIKPKNDIQRATFYFYLLSFSFSSRGENFAMAKHRGIKNICRDFSVFSRRLRHVCIENMDLAN
ncbi:hypothetical protein LS73_009340 [Helicobacter muridarum]|uniref:site-specific DNA-methyltransferase (adenine-specific) n=1 Tax=Helicobacter muridarum TaxID=216 RepID=A0A099TWE6_9HELI|nr:hypothetical protein [Helicobacter muridarum]TLD98161.1 hypothetical protein LS73_009340 [Helicobacter muridarum]STQ86485.1 Methyl-directed repair DNA adenine methylase [Helicobacter muridarum]